MEDLQRHLHLYKPIKEKVSLQSRGIKKLISRRIEDDFFLDPSSNLLALFFVIHLKFKYSTHD